MFLDAVLLDIAGAVLALDADPLAPDVVLLGTAVAHPVLDVAPDAHLAAALLP